MLRNLPENQKIKLHLLTAPYPDFLGTEDCTIRVSSQNVQWLDSSTNRTKDYDIQNTVWIHKHGPLSLPRSQCPAEKCRLLHVPAQPKARWYLDDGLNLTQHTFALASILATELSRLVDHSFTNEKKKQKDRKQTKWTKLRCDGFSEQTHVQLIIFTTN